MLLVLQLSLYLSSFALTRMEQNSNLQRQQYNAAFRHALDGLNPSQREAVEHIEGPMLVIAGPGTGKTHILAARIGRILSETDAQANNILCLTFTDAGVHAMRERLLQWIGPEGHRVHIYTFHAFCNSIIQDNLEYFGRSDIEPLSDLERVEIVRRLLDTLEPGHPLYRSADAYFYESHLQDLFQRMKSENWTPTLLQEKIDAYLEELPQRPEFRYQVNRGHLRKGDPKTAQIEEARQKMIRLGAAAALYPRYETALRQMRRYDYDDMILWVLRAFADNEVLLRSYQERYLYLLVDEYQDTNGAQNEVIRRLITYWESPNVFIVGDDDQSIFEFQGARLKNLLDFYTQYQDQLRVVVLRENYRSSQHILNASHGLIGANERRIVNSLGTMEIQKILTARSGDFAESAFLPEVFCYPNRAQEEAGVVAQIEALWQAGFPLREVAIIYARHKQVRTIATLLEKKGIPYAMRRRVNVLDLPLIRNLRTLLEYCYLEFARPYSGEHLLFQILHFDFAGIPADALAQLSRVIAGMDATERPYWREALRSREANAPRHLATSGFSEVLEDLIAQVANLSLTAFVERLVNRSGILGMVIRHPEKVWMTQVLKTFFDFVREESDRNPRLSLRRLLDILRNMDANNLALEINKSVVAANGVNLLTAHSAKGLEFQVVFMIDCVKDGWEPQARGNNGRFALPDTLTFSGEEDAMEARRRLFYVAMTRAKERLYLSYSLRDAKGKDSRPAVFIDELGLVPSERTLPNDVLAEADLLQMTELERPQIPAEPVAEINTLLEGFVVSISALNRYLRCPLSFYYENVLRAPALQSEAASYGLAAHNALQRLFERMLSSKGQRFPGLREFLLLFEREMEKMRGYFSPKDYERRLETGRVYLSAYYQQHVDHWHKKVRLELQVRNAVVDGVPITGIIDKVELHDHQRVVLVDYKTGNHRETKLRPPGGAQPYGGSYWRQLVFYKLLYENYDNSGKRADAGVISYLDPDQTGMFPQVTLPLSTEDTAFLRNLLRETYARILNHEFYEGCGEPTCAWCNFVRLKAPVNSFSGEEREELDD
ncbi:MAG: ATP-dependent helicase [Saprospiraceae bacterium]|nr:ATP-dependent helicase [Saprospiraceae bacterium]